jgi:hypothetical protein
MAEKVAPLFFRQKARQLAAALEIEHDSMLHTMPPHEEFNQEAMERDHPSTWEKYAKIESDLWRLVMELEDLAADGPMDVYGFPMEEEEHG